MHINVDITSSHVEQEARLLRRSGGPDGINSSNWQCYSLHYGVHSSHLREAVADLAFTLAICLVGWKSIRALMVNR